MHLGCSWHNERQSTMVDARGTHGLSCRKSADKGAHHQQLNDLVYRTLRRADIPAAKEPARLVRTYGKRPDGLTLIPWREGCCLSWDITIVDTLASLYVTQCASSAGAAAEAAAARKHVKYAGIATTHAFIRVVVESMGPLGHEASEFLTDLGRRLLLITDNDRETSQLFQCISVLSQRYNAVAFRDSFVKEDDDVSG